MRGAHEQQERPREPIMVQTLGSGHEDSELSDATHRVQEIRPSGMHIRHTCTWKMYRGYKHIWAWNETVSKITTGKPVIQAHITDPWD